MKNEEFIPFYRVNPSKAYDFLWVHNEHKPATLSAIEEVREAKRKDQLKDYSDVFAKRTNLSGKEYGVHRDIMNKLQNWVSSYGMVNQDELWATAVELFLRLPANHKKFIIDVVSQYM